MQALESLLPVFVLTYSAFANGTDKSEKPVLYYYGLDESERSVPACEPRQACSSFIARYWQPPALVRLCRCARRTRCDTPVDPVRTLPWNNRDTFQFCQPVDDWPECSFGSSDPHLTVHTTYDRINPYEIEEMHRKNIQLTPPKVVFTCRCREPNYWRLNTSTELEDTQIFQCYSMPICKTEEFCGNVIFGRNTLYQSCMCPKRHICVHNGGVTHLYITELLYRGLGWRAYCQRISEDDSYEDY